MSKRIYMSEIKDKCTACGACSAICPKQAIEMTEDEYGFLYPQIDEKLCVDCGRCTDICACQNKCDGNTVERAYAAISRDQDVIKNSASGGVFGTLASSFISDGYVSGAVYDNSKKRRQTIHIVTNKREDICRIQGSKYVQSSSWKSFIKIKALLDKGEKVLFSGTPCQVDALKRVTGNPDNLYTIDLICHGVPSMKMLDDYLNMMSTCVMGRIDQIIFRDKKKKAPFYARIIKKSGRSYSISAELLSYYKYFLAGKIYRKNCYACKYACAERMGDITIGDYWGIEKHHDDLALRNNHWSCVLVNSEKGDYLLEKYAGNLEMTLSKFEWVRADNGQLNYPSKMPDDRHIIMEEYRRHGYRGIEKLYRITRNGNLRYLKQLWFEMLRCNKRKQNED